MALSRIVHIGDGATRQFAIPFALGYISQDDITCRVGDEVDGLGEPLYRTLTFLSAELVEISGTAPATGVRVLFDRTTSKDELIVDFEDDAVLNEENLNTAQRQALMVAHEALDGRIEQLQADIDANGYQILNLRVPVLPQEAATKAYVDSTLPGSVLAAQEAAQTAVNAAGAAVAAAGQSAGFASAAGNSATAAQQAVIDAAAQVTLAEAAVTAAAAQVALAVTQRQGAEAAALLARAWAEKIDGPVETASFSAKYWAGVAENTVEEAIEAAIEQLDSFTGTDGTTAGQKGLVPAPATADANEWLNADGTWKKLPPDNRRVVLVDDYGAVGNGTTDDAAAFVAAQTALGAAGGIIQTSRGKRYRISALTLNTSVQIEGPYVAALRPGGNYGQSYGSMGALLLQAPINMAANTALRGLFIFPYGKTFPYSGEAAFAGTGTAVRYVNVLANRASDVTVEHCSILGFQNGIVMDGLDRVRIVSSNFDCINPIDIQDCWDICYIDKVHCWPFTTIDFSTDPGQTRHKRTGTGIYLHNTADWAKITDSFTYGYQNGIILDGVNSITIDGFGADNTPGADLWATNGVLLRGLCQDIRMTNVQTAAQGNAGVYIESTSGSTVNINGLNVWGGANHCMVVAGPTNVMLTNSVLAGTPNGLTISNAAALVTVDSTTFRDNTVANINPTVQTSNIRLGDTNRYIGAASGTEVIKPSGGGGAAVPTIPVADPLIIPKGGDLFLVSGTGAFGSARGVAAGRTVRLITLGTLTIYHSTNAYGIANGGGATLTIPAGRIITLTSEGSRWFASTW